MARVHAAVQQAVAGRAEAEAQQVNGSAPTNRSGRVGHQETPRQEAADPGAGGGPAPEEDGSVGETQEPEREPEFVPTTDAGARTRRVRSRKRRAPEQTKDDTDAGWGEYSDRSAHDRWLEEQRPPHWGSD